MKVNNLCSWYSLSHLRRIGLSSLCDEQYEIKSGHDRQGVKEPSPTAKQDPVAQHTSKNGSCLVLSA